MLQYVTISDLYLRFINLGFLIIVFSFGMSLYGATLAFVLASITVFTIAIMQFVRHMKPLIHKITDSTVYQVRELLNFSAPSFVVGFGYILLTHTDRIMIGMFLDSSAVGIYSACGKLAILMNIMLASFNSIFVPYISELYFQNRRGELSRTFKNVTKWVGASSIPLFMFFFFLARPLLSMYGREFISGRTAFVLLAFCFLINSGTGSNGFFLQMIGKQYVEVMNCALVALVNILLNFVLIKKFGINGAAIATGISLISINLLRIGEIFMFTKVHPFSESYVKIICVFMFCGFVSGLIGRFLDSSLSSSVIGFVSFLTIYMTVAFLWCLSDEDILVVEGIKRKLSRWI